MGPGSFLRFLVGALRKILDSRPIRYKSRPGVQKIEDIQLWRAYRSAKDNQKDGVR